MEEKEFDVIFSDQVLKELFPEIRANQFFEALYGDIQEGAYDIGLKFKNFDPQNNQFHFDLELKERPGKCLACNLTYGLPQVFARHPVINVKGIVQEIEKILGSGLNCQTWSLGRTDPVSSKLHVIPLTIQLS